MYTHIYLKLRRFVQDQGVNKLKKFCVRHKSHFNFKKTKLQLNKKCVVASHSEGSRPTNNPIKFIYYYVVSAASGLSHCSGVTHGDETTVNQSVCNYFSYHAVKSYSCLPHWRLLYTSPRMQVISESSVISSMDDVSPETIAHTQLLFN